MEFSVYMANTAHYSLSSMEKENNNESMRVCLLGASFDTGNMGVSALAESSIKCILRGWPDAEVTILGSGRVESEHKLKLLGREIRIKEFPIRFCRNVFLSNHFCVLLLYALLMKFFRWRRLHKALAKRNACLKAIIEANMIADITGGDSFTDIYGLRRFIVGFLHKWLVKVYRKKLVLLPQTYGPFNKRIPQALARHILNYATVVYTRDQYGIRYLKKLLNTENADGKVKFVPDIGFILDSHRPQNKNIVFLEKIKTRNTVVVGLNISGLLFHGGYTQDNMFKLKVDYPALINSIIDLLMKHGNTFVLLLPHVFPPPGFEVSSDLIVCKKVHEQTVEKYKNRILLVCDEYNCSEMKYVIHLCDFFIGSRMHSCIAALSQGIPAVGLAYSKKFEGVFESVGVRHLVVDMRRYRQDDILTAIRSAFDNRKSTTEHLRRIIPDVEEKILNIFRDVV